MTKQQHLAAIDPELADKICRILDAMESLGFPMKIVSSIRTEDEQKKLYAKGRTESGFIVTYMDGVTKKSKHQLGLAVDCAFVIDGVPSWDTRLPWKTYGSCAEAVGLIWGGSWRTLIDLPHVELRR